MAVKFVDELRALVENHKLTLQEQEELEARCIEAIELAKRRLRRMAEWGCVDDRWSYDPSYRFGLPIAMRIVAHFREGGLRASYDTELRLLEVSWA